MSATIVNAAPMSIMLGAQDLSTRQLPQVPVAVPTHLPKIYNYAQKGPVTPQFVSGADMVSMYGADTFDMRKGFATHATELTNLINSAGNAIMFERVVPADAAPAATLSLWLDVLPTMLQVYERNIDGSYMVDSNNNPIPVTPAQTVAGYSVMWITKPIAVDVNGNSLFGQAEPMPGVQTDSVSSTQSTQYPIIDGVVPFQGSFGNNNGLRIWAPTVKSSAPINPSLISSNQCYPFRMACVSRVDATSTPSVVPTQDDEQYVDVVFKNGTIDKSTDSLVGINDVFINAYQALNNIGYAPIWGPFGQLYTYDLFIDTLLKQFYAAELPYINSFSDIIGIPNEEYVFNMISGLASSSAPYTSFVVTNIGANGGVYLSENTTIYASGGTDGTMGEATTLSVASIKGSISGNVLSISSGATLTLAAGQFISGTGVTPGTTLVSGSGNTWEVSESQTVSTTTISVTVPGFASLVADAITEYGNIDSILQDSATFPESVFWDSGFPLETKYAIANFIAIRKDTAVGICCHDVTQPPLTASEESSLAVAIRTRLQLFPESDFYGTPTVRAIIVGRSGMMLNSQYNKHLPLILELAYNAAGYMGAGNGIWKSGAGFDSSPNNQVKLFAANTVNVKFTPAAVRNKDWANGLVWVDAFDIRSLYFPALKTVYNNDTSVLTSFFTMMAVVELEKVAERARRTYSGEAYMTDPQLVFNVNKFVNDNTLGRFDGRFVIRPNTYFTSADVKRGFSWTLDIAIYAPNMRTVATISVKSYRLSDLPTT